MSKSKHKVLILGGGFGGIKTALELAKYDPFDINLMSDHDDFRFYPSLYHTATGGSRVASSIPLNEIFAGKPVKITIDSAKKLERGKKQIIGSSKNKYPYDSLVISLGVITNYFGIRGLPEYSYGIKSNRDAQELRDHLHKLMFNEQKPDLNYVVIGGGPSGVELAGALPAYLRHIMESHGIVKKNIHVDLVEAMPRLLPHMPLSYSRKVHKRLRKLGVKLYLGEAVKAETADKLSLSDKSLDSHTVVWTAGVTNHPFFSDNKFSITDHGKVIVNEILQAEPGIYVIGDNAETRYSGLAQTALHDGKFVANNLLKAVSGKTLDLYSPKRPIIVNAAGPRWAAMQWGRFELFGKLGWLMRSSADFLGYHDYEPWWQASKHWLAQSASEENCPICAGGTTPK